jgi:hypothetical protein
MMAIMIIPTLQSPHQGGSSGGQIIKMVFFININTIVNNELLDITTYNVDLYHAFFKFIFQ